MSLAQSPSAQLSPLSSAWPVNLMARLTIQFSNCARKPSQALDSRTQLRTLRRVCPRRLDVSSLTPFDFSQSPIPRVELSWRVSRVALHIEPTLPLGVACVA